MSPCGVDIHDSATGELRCTLPDREGTDRDNGDIALWDLAKIDRQMAELGLGFARD